MEGRVSTRICRVDWNVGRNAYPDRGVFQGRREGVSVGVIPVGFVLGLSENNIVDSWVGLMLHARAMGFVDVSIVS